MNFFKHDKRLLTPQRILITGATGFIGQNIAAYMRASYEICCVGRKNLDTASNYYTRAEIGSLAFQELLAGFQPDVVIHCAGLSSVVLSMQEPALDFESGPVLTYALYEALRKAKITPLVIQISSAALYGNPKKLPILESDSIEPISAYGWHKQLSESIGHEFAMIYGIPGLALRVFSCYGAGQRKLLLWDCCCGIISGELRLYGSGQESRDYIHVSDLARAIDFLFKTPCSESFRAINIGSGKQSTVSQIVDILRAAMPENEVEPIYEKRQLRGVPVNWQANITLLEATGFSAHINLEDGVKDYARWFVQMRNKI